MNDEALVLAAVRRAMEGAAGDLSPDAVLQQLVDAALDLVGARYAALGVPDGDGGFARFITAGMDDELIESLGPLPRTHGLLGAMLTSREPYRTADIRQDPRFTGWWPDRHPDMRSFLGYPIVFKGDVVGAFYLTDKVEVPTFSERDQRLVGQFAPHAAVLVELARLYGESRELSVAAERNRIARELHDSLTQTLFGARLALRTASGALAAPPREQDGAEGPPPATAAVEQLDRAVALLNTAFDELRAMIWDLQPPDLEVDRLTGAVRKQLALLERTSGLHVTFHTAGDADGLDPEIEHQLFRIVQEAMTNAARHAEATTLAVRITAPEPDGEHGPGDAGTGTGTGAAGHPGPGQLRIEVRDDGKGFDPHGPAVRSRRLGLTSMTERAEAVGGRLTLTSRPGRGTTVTVEAPGG